MGSLELNIINLLCRDVMHRMISIFFDDNISYMTSVFYVIKHSSVYQTHAMMKPSNAHI